MLRKIVAGTVLTGLAFTGLGATSASAGTATNGPLTITVPDAQVYKAKGCAEYPYTLKVDVPTDSEYWAVALVAGRTKLADGAVQEGTGDQTVEGTLTLCPKKDGVGAFTYYAEMAYLSQADVDPVSASAETTSVMLAPTKVTTVVTPKHVKVGKTIKARGKVTYRTTKWKVRPVKRQPVTLQFLPDGATQWQVLETKTTKGNGTYSFKTKASVDGTYQVTYGGDGGAAGTASATRWIDVR